ncbi:MAG TPA: hypothetical protein VLQ46_05835 [Casimicrobiaceae bacterium]|nr:hypothetical protein [Casimicrobiaceae bacterium]
MFLALAWPSLGPLPWIALAASPHHHHHHDGAHDADDVDLEQAIHHFDASDIPGSPTHPSDHDCLQCQVLKHLSRCVLAPPVAAEVMLPAGCPVRPGVRAESQHARDVALLPPVRAPPPRAA